MSVPSRSRRRRLRTFCTVTYRFHTAPVECVFVFVHLSCLQSRACSIKSIRPERCTVPGRQRGWSNRARRAFGSKCIWYWSIIVTPWRSCGWPRVLVFMLKYVWWCRTPTIDGARLKHTQQHHRTYFGELYAKLWTHDGQTPNQPLLLQLPVIPTLMRKSAPYRYADMSTHSNGAGSSACSVQ